MIGILDQFEISPANLGPLLSLIEAQYLPGATRRGMTRRSTWISPPIALSDAPNTLWVMWEVPDVGALWNMRFQSGADPSVTIFWEAADALCLKRERHYLIDGKAAHLAQALDLGTARTIHGTGIRQTAQYFLRKDAAPEDIEAWQKSMEDLPRHIPGIQRSFVGRNLEGSFNAGDFTFDAHFIDAGTLHAAQSHTYWNDVIAPLQDTVMARITALKLRLISGGLRKPDIGPSIKRTAFFRILPGANPDSLAAWEKDLLDMPRYMKGMTNWSLSKSADDDRLYVWEQEYPHLDDLLGEYMLHPHHWAHVDTWFDPEFSRRIVDTDIFHAFCESSDNILSWVLNT